MAGPTTFPALLAAAALASASAPVGDAALRAEVDRAVAAASAVRHLPFHGPLQVRAIGPDSIRGEIAAAIAAGSPSSGPAAEEPFLRRLRLIPPSADYTRLLAESYSATPVPTYDPGAKRLLVPDTVPLEQQTSLLPHEIAHALTDQRFGLRRLLQIGPDGGHRLAGDAERARLALIEGDATLTALEVADPLETFLGARELQALVSSLRQAASGSETPSWLATLGRFTHVDGLMFVARVRARQPWKAVDRLWDDPPSSTEQLLHPEKYDACEEPIRIDDDLLPTLPGLGRPTATAVLGELVIRSWLANVLPPEIAERAAAGWGGDRAGVYAPRAEPVQAHEAQADRTATGDARQSTAEPPLAWLTVWDDAGEAEDFARAAAAAGVEEISRRGEAVALLFGVTDDPPAVLADMLDGWRRHDMLSRTRGARPRRGARPSCPRRDRAAAPR